VEKLNRLVSGLSAYMSVVAGVTLVLVMLLVVLDVTMRYFGYPITGVYDLVALGGAIIIGFTCPYAAQKRVHVFMEMIQQAHGRALKRVLDILTRLMAFGISLLIGWNLLALGASFHTKGEASLTIQIAYYPVAFGLAACFFIQAAVFAVQVLQVFVGGNDE
jgi:TRAP-type C4-dicarboxylate transport system permease small subunit